MSEWHIITCEYPPHCGGVGDYTKLVAEGLAEAGDRVHVWAPSEEQRAKGEERDADSSLNTHHSSPMVVHREFGRFRPRDLRRVGKQLDRFPVPRRLLVQWVPHGYGYRSMNLPFCFWLWWRAKFKGDRVELMVHEPYLPFAGSLKQHGAAMIHRLMTILLLRVPRHVWLAIPAWKEKLVPYALGRQIPFRWLPLPSNVPWMDDPKGRMQLRARYASVKDTLLGHYGSYSPGIFDFLLQCLSGLLPKHDDLAMLLMGPGSERLRERLIQINPALSRRVHATGALSIPDSSRYISACHIMLQPYPDGVTSRRTTVMAGLALQLPIVTTDGELTESMWAESGSVVLAPAGNVPAFIASVDQLLTDEAACRQLSIAAKKLYSERFDIRHTVEALRACRT